MNDFGFNSNGFVRQFLDKPIATYTHTTNKEIMVSAVDVDTDTFTSVGHGLANGDILYMVINNDAGLIFLVDKIPGGLTSVTNQYYVVNKTDDTFQLSLTSGGAAIDITDNANLDLTKWHFEKVDTNNVQITNLSLYRCRLLISGKSLHYNATQKIFPNNLTGLSYIRSSNGTFGEPLFYVPSTIRFRCEVLFDYTTFASIWIKGFGVAHKDASSNTVATINNNYFAPSISSATKIQSIYFNNWYFANGSRIEVYRV